MIHHIIFLNVSLLVDKIKKYEGPRDSCFR